MRCALAVILTLLTSLPGSASVRLLGLDRLYFSRQAVPGEGLDAPDELQLLIPMVLEPEDSLRHIGRIYVDDNHCSRRAGASASEFLLPASKSTDLWLRTVSQHPEMRIPRTWWALYNGSSRSDVWYFDASAAMDDSKLLSNYEVEGVAKDSLGIAIRITGNMFRPGGRYWMTGKVFVFSESDSALELYIVENTFGFYANEDSLSVLTESRVPGGFTTSSCGPVPLTLLEECGFDEQGLFMGDWNPTWEELAGIAHCITDSDGAVTGFRHSDSLSFVERGTLDPRTPE